MGMYSAGRTHELVAVRPQGILTHREGQFHFATETGRLSSRQERARGWVRGGCPVCLESRAGLEAGAAPSSLCLDAVCALEYSGCFTVCEDGAGGDPGVWSGRGPALSGPVILSGCLRSPQLFPTGGASVTGRIKHEPAWRQSA